MNKIKYCLLLLTLLIIPNYAFGVPIVYVTKNPSFFQSVQVMRNLGWHIDKEGRDKMINYLLSKGYIEKMTPELAYDKYKIAWIENDIGVKRLIIVDLGHEVGSGLFTVDPHEKDVVIAEYLGKRITDLANYVPTTYDADGSPEGEPFLMIGALKKGGAARFANHAPDESELAKYDLRNGLKQDEIAIPNSRLITQQGRVFLVATKHADAFEQVLFCYKRSYGYPHHIYSNDPLLFYKNWHPQNGYIIPSQDYAYRQSLVIFEPRGSGFFEAQVEPTLMFRLLVRGFADRGFTYWPVFSEGKETIWCKINFQELQNQLSQTTKSRLSVRGEVLKSQQVQELDLDSRSQAILKGIPEALQEVAQGAHFQ